MQLKVDMLNTKVGRIKNYQLKDKLKKLDYTYVI